MTQAAEALSPRRASDARLVSTVSAAHFVSHYYIMLLPPLFAFVREDYGVSYTELGLALTAFNIVTGALQTPAGFLVDWLGARMLLIAGLLFGGVAFAAAGLIHSFWVLVAMFGLAGVGNAIYHPADYAMLSRHIVPERIGRAFSIHTFAGMLGSAVAPATLLLMQNSWGWRGAFIGAGLFGLVVAAVLALQREESVLPGTQKTTDDPAPAWRVLLSTPILLNLVFFALLALISAGLSYYSVVALGALYGTPAAVANAALSGFLLFAALGVLAGGVLAGRTARHGLVTGIGLVVLAALSALIARVDLGDLALIVAMSVGGLFSGAIMPARDMIVRAVTPPGSFGKVFGFVTTGFNLGGIVAPLIFGAVLDNDRPGLVFLLVAAFCLLSIGTVAFGQTRAPAARN